ncbi:YolD-like family protein [Lysinibacillus sp. NPDC097214]|uniref:YolD-like family protein n=1 Tax=Lysinibacillus sp. NPDC097214 TaxID=3390584 RepID=UPI003D002EAE
MIKDRGSIKFTAMMMPEHLELLREFKQGCMEQQRELTEWELEELQQTINLAYGQRQDVKLDVWSDGKTTQWIGKINAINTNTNELIFETLLKTKRIPLQNICSAQLDADYYD